MRRGAIGAAHLAEAWQCRRRDREPKEVSTRIASGGLMHETCTFSALPTRLSDFRRGVGLDLLAGANAAAIVQETERLLYGEGAYLEMANAVNP